MMFALSGSNKVVAFLDSVVAGSGISCEIRLPSGTVHRYGSEPPEFIVTFKNDRRLRSSFDEFAFADAYVNGDIEIEGDMVALLRLRTRIHDKVRLVPWLRFLGSRLFKSETNINRRVGDRRSASWRAATILKLRIGAMN